ncbi:Hsp70 family protein [Kribbella sp. NPDC006257]|uniref:Hsp70 family protein n=1 Tax=Kribbella sp. NPDC006257 TaxID=3156738 RepID=UPI0033B179ED
MVGLGNRALQIPSVLYLQEDGSFLVGEAAERRGLSDPSRVVREFKRRLGDPVPLIVGGTPFSAQVLMAKLLSWVVAAATERRGAEPDEIVLTHPANWGPYRREFFDQIIALADIGPAVTCPEPQAAAIQYAAEARLDRGSRVVVYDLGGGTFDVCVLEKTLGGFKILGTPEGIEHLGGIDFDEAVFRHVLDSLGAADLEAPAARAALTRLRRDCVEAKEALSVDVDTVIPVTLPGRSTSVRLTRGELESLIEPALTDTMEATARALRVAGTTPQRLTAIVLVGGSSRIPLVSHLLQNRFGTPTALDTHPKHAIALGAVLFSPPGPRPRPADRPTIHIPIVDDDPPTLAIPPSSAPTAPAGPTAPGPSAISTGRSGPTLPPEPRPSGPPPPPRGAPSPGSGPPRPAGVPAYRKGRLLAVVAAVVAVIAIGAVIFSTRDHPSGEAAKDPTTPATSPPTSVAPVGNAALYGVAVSPDNRQIYVTHLNENTLSVIDERTGRLTATVPVGSKPLGVAVSGTTGTIYTADYGSSTVTRISGSTYKPVGPPIKVGRHPQTLIVLPGKEIAYVANAGDDTVSVLDLSLGKVVKTISVGDQPINLATDTSGRRVYVANAASSTITVINAASRTRHHTLRVARPPHGIAVSPGSDQLYLTSDKSGEIAVVDVADGTTRSPIVVGSEVADLAIAPAVGRLYATLVTAGGIAIVDTTTGALAAADRIAVDGPGGIGLSPDRQRLYVTANGTASLITIDTATGRVLGEPIPVPR